MSTQPTNILFIGSNKKLYKSVKSLLKDTPFEKYKISQTDSLTQAAKKIEQHTYQIILAQDSTPMENTHTTPYILLSTDNDPKARDLAIESGAADCLPLTELNAILLQHSIRYAINHQKVLEQLKHASCYDTLTGLANRDLLQEELTKALNRSRRNQTRIGVLYLDLDNFKKINDTLGHPTGDALLKLIAKRLATAVRENDTVARLGGDEFAILLDEIHLPADAAEVAKNILHALSQPLFINEQHIVITASIGIATHPESGHDSESLLTRADAAMYAAKEAGRNQIRVWQSSEKTSQQKYNINNSTLKQSLLNDEFFLNYQPQIDTETGKLIGMEALIRWQHPERGLIPPNEFIGIAESSGIIVDIGEWVLKTACEQYKKWGLDDVKLSINLSLNQLIQKNIVDSVSSIVKNSGIHPNALELELTESALMQNPQTCIERLNALTSQGISLAIDDFGTGYSSLSYLKKLPLDILKIDIAFVRDINLDPNNTTIVKSTITLAHELGLQTIAEGVETQDQFNFLGQHRCDKIQGYYFSKPLSTQDMTAFIKKRRVKA